MPVLQKIVVQDFRNIELQELSFSPNVNCISGGNGQGKTNLCDAIYYLSMTKSYSGSPDQFNYRHGTKGFSIAGTYAMESGLRSTFAIQSCDGGDKKLRRDDKPYKRLSDHIGVLPVVMVSPADVSLVSEGGEQRRRFVNAVLSQTDHEYLASLQQYNRLLQQRNALLKDGHWDETLMLTIDAGMSRLSAIIKKRREAFIAESAPVVERYYEQISGGHETVALRYRSDLDKAPLEELLLAGRERDRMLGYTLYGVQRDDFEFTMDGYPIRKCGSQGQQKSFLVALKFAQYEVMKGKYGFAPTLLLDDLFDKLDQERVANLLTMVAGQDFGQIFLSDTSSGRLSEIIDGVTQDRAYFEACEGTFKTK